MQALCIKSCEKRDIQPSLSGLCADNAPRHTQNFDPNAPATARALAGAKFFAA